MPNSLLSRQFDRPIILASQSPRRANLLEQAGFNFTVRPADINESQFESLQRPPEAIAILLARKKASVIARQLSDPAFVIGADTIVCDQNIILGKPKDSEEAKTTLHHLSGQSHEVITGVAIIKTPEAQEVAFAERTEVHFRDLSEDEILAYVDTGEPMDKAGAYGIQGLGALLVEYIHGDYNNVVGFPLTAFYRHFSGLLSSQ